MRFRKAFFILSTLAATSCFAAKDVKVYGAKGDGVTDDTLAIQRALTAAAEDPIDKVVTFPTGRYVTTDVLRANSVSISGAGISNTVIVAKTALRSSIILYGANSSVRDLTVSVEAANRARSSDHEAWGIAVYKVSGFSVTNVKVSGACSGGILIYSSTGTPTSRSIVAGNYIEGTLADGIHISGGSAYIDVTSNNVTNTEDDMIAVVSYLSDGEKSHDITITNNTCRNQNWGRGISVVGGFNVKIDSNLIEDSHGSGIYIASETSYNTFEVHDIVASNNILRRCPKAIVAGYGGINVTGRVVNGNIYMAERVTLSQNRVENAAGHGIFAGQLSRDVLVTGNTIQSSALSGAYVTAHAADWKFTSNIFNDSTRCGLETEIGPDGLIFGDLNEGNTISGTGLYGIYIPPNEAKGTIRISYNTLSGVNRNGLSYIDVINIAKSTTIPLIEIKGNFYDALKESTTPERFIEAWSSLSVYDSNTTNSTTLKSTAAVGIVAPYGVSIKVEI